MRPAKRTTLFLLLVTIAYAWIMAGSWVAPEAGANGTLGIKWMLIISRIAPLTTLGAGAVAFSIGRGLLNVPGWSLGVVVVTALGCSVAQCVFVGPQQRNVRFIERFAYRVHSEVGEEELWKFFDAVEADVKNGRRVDAILNARDLPEHIKKLYPRPYGSAPFDDKGTLIEIRIMWGSPLYRWGIEMKKDSITGVRAEVAWTDLATNIVCFVSK